MLIRNTFNFNVHHITHCIGLLNSTTTSATSQLRSTKLLTAAQRSDTATTGIQDYRDYYARAFNWDAVNCQFRAPLESCPRNTRSCRWMTVHVIGERTRCCSIHTVIAAKVSRAQLPAITVRSSPDTMHVWQG
jgi:hypothetical protein